MVFNMMMMTNQNAVVMSFSKPSIAAISDVNRRRTISNMATIISGEELAVNIDDKNSKCTSKTFFFRISADHEVKNTDVKTVLSNDFR